MLSETHFDALTRVAQALAGELELQELLEQVVQAAKDAVGADYAALGVIGDDGSLAQLVHVGIDEDTARKIGPLPTGQGIVGLLLSDPQTLRLDDISAHPAAHGFPEHHPVMQTFLGTPVRSGGTVFGNLYLADKDGGFDDDDERLIEALAAQAGTAIENAMLADRLQQVAVRAERERISRDLHDGVIQTLFSIGMGLDSARGLVGAAPERVAKRIDDAIDAIDTTIRDLRNTIFHLRADDAAALGLRDGLVELAREHEVNALTRPALKVSSNLDFLVPAAVVPDALQVVREALNNVARHAQATEVTVGVHHLNAHLRIVVHDDGVGFDPSEPSAGHGLSNIRERAELHGGVAIVESSDGQGTRVMVELPTKG